MIKRLVQELDDEIAATQAIIVRDQRWEKRTKTNYVTVEMKDDFASAVTNENVEDHTLGVLVVAPDLQSVSSGMWTTEELRDALRKRGLSTKVSSEHTTKQAKKLELQERILVALKEEGGTEVKKEVVATEVQANVLVGAEEHEARLEELLRRKRELLGEV